MSRKDRVTDELQWLRLLVAFGLTVELSIVGWLVHGTSPSHVWVLYVAWCIALGGALGLAVISRTIFNRLRQLEDL